MHTILLLAMMIQAPAPAPVAEIPFELNRCGMPVVVLKVGGEDFSMIVDTASTRTRLSNQHRTKEATDNPVVLFLSETKSVTIPKIGFADLSQPRKDCGPMDGLLGNEVLSGAHSVTIDYKHKRLILNYGEGELR